MKGYVKLGALPPLRFVGLRDVAAAPMSRIANPIALQDLPEVPWHRPKNLGDSFALPPKYEERGSRSDVSPESPPPEVQVASALSSDPVDWGSPMASAMRLNFAVTDVDVTGMEGTTFDRSSLVVLVLFTALRLFRDFVDLATEERAPIHIHFDSGADEYVIPGADRLTLKGLGEALAQRATGVDSSSDADVTKGFVLQVSSSGNRGLLVGVQTPIRPGAIALDIGGCEPRAIIVVDQHGDERLAVRRILTVSLAGRPGARVVDYLADLKAQLEGR